MSPSSDRGSLHKSPDEISQKHESHDLDVSSSQESHNDVHNFHNGAINETANDGFEKQGKMETGGVTSSISGPEELSTSLPDPNIIDWEPDDAQNPKNWPISRKWFTVFIVSANTLMTALGSTIPAPAVPLLMQEFHSNNDLLESFVVSIYVLGFAFGPLSKFRVFNCRSQDCSCSQ